MYLVAVKLARTFFWGAIAVGLLTLLFPQYISPSVPLTLAVACVICFLYAVWHVRQTRRFEFRCPTCGWIPFALPAWKCKQCAFIWDSFSTQGVCPRCRHAHEETACVRCRKIARNPDWLRDAN